MPSSFLIGLNNLPKSGGANAPLTPTVPQVLQTTKWLKSVKTGICNFIKLFNKLFSNFEIMMLTLQVCNRLFVKVVRNKNKISDKIWPCIVKPFNDISECLCRFLRKCHR